MLCDNEHTWCTAKQRPGIKRQASMIKRKRPTSAPPSKNGEEGPKKETVDLRSYSKSLALLGLDIPSNRREATKLEDVGLEVRTNSPTMRTRLTARNAKATEDLRTKVEKVPDKKGVDKTDFNLIRRPLCDAVFEEWYFRKLHQYKMKKAEEEIAANRCGY